MTSIASSLRFVRCHPTLRQAARHESGHSVAAYILGGYVMRVTLQPIAETQMEGIRPADLARAIWAGCASEMLLTGFVAAPLPGQPWTDLQLSRIYLGNAAPAVMIVKAIDWLRPHRAALHAVARELLLCRSLPGEQVREIVRETMLSSREVCHDPVVPVAAADVARAAASQRSRVTC